MFIGVNMFKNKTKIFASLAFLMMALLGFSSNVLAQECGSCDVFLPQIAASTHAIAIATGTTATSTSELATTMTQLNTYLEYGVGGTSITSMGGGVIAQLQSINDTLSEVQQQQVDNGQNSDQLAKIRQYNAANNKVNMTHMPSNYNTSCSDGSLAMGFAGGGNSGGGALPSTPSGSSGSPPPNYAGDAVYYVRNTIRDRNYNSNANLGSQMLAHDGSGSGGINFCTANDALYNREGCTTGNVGTYPGGDTDANNLIYGAQTPNASTPSIHTLNATQQQVAAAVINNIVPQVPAGVTSQVSKSPLANAYSVGADEIRARISVIDKSLADAVSLYGANPHMNAESLSTWQGSSAEYAKVYGSNTPFPQIPSPYQQYDFEVMRRMADPQWVTGLNSMDEKDVMAEVAKIDVLRARIELDHLAQGQETNMLLSVIAAQSIDPKTLESLRAQLSSISPSGQ
jgi:hypothetical protein